MWIKFAEKHNLFLHQELFISCDYGASHTRLCDIPTSLLQLCHKHVMLYGLPNSCILKLQRIQNSAARMIYLRKKFDHVTPLLKQSHWLPIIERIEYKLLLLFFFKSQHGLGPCYLKDLILHLAHFASNLIIKISEIRKVVFQTNQTKFKSDKNWARRSISCEFRTECPN